MRILFAHLLIFVYLYKQVHFCAFAFLLKNVRPLVRTHYLLHGGLIMKLSRTLWTKLLAVGLGATMALGVGLTASKVAEEVRAATANTENFSSFSSGGTASSYLTRTTNTSGNPVFTATNARIDTSNLSGAKICVNGGAITATFTSGLSKLEFDYRKVYSDTGGTITIKINGTQLGSVINVANNQGQTAFSQGNLTYTGSVSLEIAINKRIGFYFIGWDNYSASSGTATITNGDTLSLKTTDTGITLTGTSSGITSPSYAWSSDNTNVVTVSSGSSTSSVTIQGSGTARVTLTVSGTGGPASDYIDITVSAVVQGISVDVSSTHATTCPLWGTYSPSGLKIKVDNHMGTDPVIDTGFSVSSIDTSSLGPKTVTVTLDADNTKTTTFSVKITNSGAAVVNEGISTSDLIISEYIEGTSNNKAIEIYNGTGASVDLSNYSLKKQANGAGAYGSELKFSETELLLSNGDVYVAAHSSANATILAQADVTKSSAPLDFNGNDAVGLFKNGTRIDEVGIFSQTSDWGKDITLVRKSSITSPSATYSAGDWDVYPTDTATYLGSHGGAAFDKSLDQATAYAAFLTTGWAATNFCAHTTTVLEEVNAEYNAMHADAKTAFNNNGAFATARANKAYMTNYAASNPKTSAETIASSSRTTLIAATVIGILGLSTLAGFYFQKKKKESL